MTAPVDSQIQAGVNQLEQFPLLGDHGWVAGTREIVVTGTPCVVVYRVKDDMVQILRVLHHSKQYLN